MSWQPAMIMDPGESIFPSVGSDELEGIPFFMSVASAREYIAEQDLERLAVITPTREEFQEIAAQMIKLGVTQLAVERTDRRECGRWFVATPLRKVMLDMGIAANDGPGDLPAGFHLRKPKPGDGDNRFRSNP